MNKKFHKYIYSIKSIKFIENYFLKYFFFYFLCGGRFENLASQIENLKLQLEKLFFV